MEKLLQKGFNIGFDTIGKEAYLKDELRIANLKKLILDGYGNQIVLSQDISRKSYFSICENKYGFKTVMEKFVPACLNAGITEEEIKKLLIENPRRIFNIED